MSNNNPYDNLTFVDVVVQSDPDWDTEEVLVVIGDETVKFDENFDYDERVYFHFDNRAQFERARKEMLEEVGFIVVEVIDEDELEPWTPEAGDN